MAQEWLRIAKFYFDLSNPSVFTAVSSTRVRAPSYVAEGAVLSIDPIDRSVGVVPGLPQISGTKISVADPHGDFRALVRNNPARRCLVDIKLVQADTAEADGFLLFSGEVIDPEFPPARVDFRLKDHLFAFLDEKFPPMIVSEIHPWVNPKDEGGFLNIICGEMNSIGADPRGVVPCPHAGFTNNEDRYGLACHPVWSVNQVYRNGPDGWELVDPSEYVVTEIPVTAWNIDMTHVFLCFFVDQKGAEIRADVSGFFYPGDTGPRQNPMDAFKGINYFLIKKAGIQVNPFTGLGVNFDPVSFQALETLFNQLLYVCDGLICESITGREWIGRWSVSFNTRVFQNVDGLIAVHFTDNTAPPVPVVSITEGKYILRETFFERYPDQVLHKLTFRYAYSGATKNFEITRTATAESTLPDASLEEKGTVDLHFVRVAEVAADVIKRRLEFLAPTSMRQEFHVPMPPLLGAMDLADTIALTHSQGLGISSAGYNDQPVMVYDLTADTNRLVFVVKTAIAVQRNITFSEGGDSETAGEGGTGEGGGDGPGECCGAKIYRTDFDNEPSTAKEADVDMYANADVIARLNDSDEWQTYGPIFPLERPLAKTLDVTDVFTPVNQGSATTDITHSGIHVLAPANSGTSLRAFVQSLGSPPSIADGDLHFYVSHDPHLEHWQEVFTITQGVFLTPDQIGFFVNEASGVLDLRTTLLHWVVDTEGFDGGFLSNFFGLDSQSFGLLVRESSTGKMITLQQTSTGSGLLLDVKKYDDENTINEDSFSQLLLSPFKFMRIGLKTTRFYEVVQVDGTKKLAASPFTLQYYPVTLIALEKSQGGQITSIKYWHNTDPLDTSTGWVDLDIEPGLWTTIGIDLTSNDSPEQTVSGLYRYFYARIFLGGPNETRILRSPDAWPELNTLTAWSEPALSEAFNYILDLNFISNIAPSTYTTALSNTKIYKSDDNGQTWTAGASIPSGARAVNDGGTVVAVKGNTIYVSYDDGDTIDHTIMLDAGDDWTDIATDEDVWIVCGQGTNKVALSDDVATTFAAMTVPGAWDPTDPRIRFQYATPGSPGAGHPWIISDATPGATSFLRNTDPTIPNAWALVTVPAPTGVYSALAWSWQPDPAGPDFAFFIAVHADGYSRSLDGGATWAAKAWTDSPLS